MKIVVTGEKTISAVEEKFHECFPFLKIAFFKEGDAPSDKTRIPANKKFEAYSANGQAEHIHITPTLTVAELEEKFMAHYRLVIQVYRKSGKAWLETTLTDSWTLQEQNEQGKELSGR